MPILHRFQNTPLEQGFYTEHSILKSQDYEPQVLFVGTFNPELPWNPSDFFYGRGMYMWTILGNFFLEIQNQYRAARNFNNDIPTKPQIYEICRRGKIAFADIIKGTADKVPVRVDLANTLVVVNNTYVWKSYKDTPLVEMGNSGWLDTNVNEIIKYINNTPSLKHVYFTFKSGDWLLNKRNQIMASILPHVTVHSIFTPTGNGFKQNLVAPFQERAWSIAHCWVWNGLPHQVLINKPGVGTLNHQWLEEHGVNPHNF